MPLQAPKCDICGNSDTQVTCTTCETNYCKLCDQKLHVDKRKNHQRIPYTGTELPSRLCTITGHEGQPLNLYCQTCLKPICAFCLIGEHKNHSSIPIKDAVENVKTIIQDNIVPFQEQIAKIDQEIKAMEEEMKKIEDKIKEAKTRRSETSQKLETLKSWVNKKDVDPYAFLSLVSELKLDSKQVADLDPVGVWLKKPVRNWKLLYKWTKDEKTNVAWYRACAGKGPTVTVVRTKDGHVFGGYAHISWLSLNSGYEWKESMESFIFSITDGKGRKPYQCLQTQPSQHSLCSYANSSKSCFGWGANHDLYINPESLGSYSNLNGTYKLPQGFSDNQTWLAGSYTTWQIVEIETYLV